MVCVLMLPDVDLHVKSDVDGDQDCFPITYTRCSPGQTRDAAGACTSPDCNSVAQCSSGRGTWDPAIGLCNCVVDAPVQVPLGT